MVLTKRQKVLVGVCGLALVAFVADRISSGGSPVGPSEASASSATDAGGGGSGLATGTAGVALAPAWTASGALADRLEALAKANHPAEGDLRDAFCPSKVWVGQDVMEVPVANSDEPAVQNFADEHQLEAVAQGPAGGIAIINGKPLVVGQVVGGFKLVSVGKGHAVLVSDGARVILRLPADSGQAPAQ